MAASVRLERTAPGGYRNTTDASSPPSSPGQNLVPEQEIQNQEDHEKRRASTRTQSQLQRPHGLQLSAVPGRLGHAGPVQGAQPAATEHQHHGLEFFGNLGVLVHLSRQHRGLPFAEPQLDTALFGSWSWDVILKKKKHTKTKTKAMLISDLFFLFFFFLLWDSCTNFTGICNCI